MIAILTKYHGPTNNHGAYISATANKVRVSIPYPNELSGEDVHKKAAEALCAKMKWVGKLIGGATDTGYAFVFVSGWTECFRAANRLADMVCAMYHPNDPKARQTFPVATWAEIIAQETGIETLEEEMV